MNWLAIAAALAGAVRMLAAVAARWLEDRRVGTLQKLSAKARAHDLLAKAVAARNRAADDIGGVRDRTASPDRHQRD